MTEVTGKIQWLPNEPKVNNFNKEDGEYNVGIKINNNFYNQYGEQSQLESLLKKIKVGYELKLEVLGNKIQSLGVVSDKIEEKKSQTTSPSKTQKIKIGEKEYDAEYANISGKKHILFGSLTKIAKAECKEIRYEILEKYVSEDFKKAWIHGRLHVKLEDGIEMYFDAMGSSTPENTGAMTITHPIEMADTRWKGRAIRVFLGIGEAMSEEIKQ